MQDVGTATSATTTTISANSNPNKVWDYGTGYISDRQQPRMGQWRNITSKSGNTFTVDKAWTVVPAAGDNFAIFHASMENGLIRNNTLQNNPSSILLYHQASYNVSIVNNSITDNGGIFIYGQDINNGRYPQTGSTSNIEVIGNTSTDRKANGVPISSPAIG